MRARRAGGLSLCPKILYACGWPRHFVAVCGFNPHKILQSASIISIVHLGKLGASVLKATNAPALVALPCRWEAPPAPASPVGSLLVHANC